MGKEKSIVAPKKLRAGVSISKQRTGKERSEGWLRDHPWTLLGDGSGRKQCEGRRRHGLPWRPQLGVLAAERWHHHPSRARLAREVRAGWQGVALQWPGSWRQA